MVARLDELTAPPVPGRFYWVPTVVGMWHYTVRAWPVIGPRHNDTRCLQFEHQHYHIDGRFVSGDPEDRLFWRQIGAAPLMLDSNHKPALLPRPEWRRRKCRFVVSPHVGILPPLTAGHAHWQCHFGEWEGKQARHDGRGWVCPHRSVPLADHPAIDGVITCPLHFLRICATSGRVLPQPAAEAVR